MERRKRVGILTGGGDYGDQGVWAGVDVALWDIIGKAKNISVYKLLSTNTEPDPHIHIYASGGDYHTWYEDGERLCQRIYGDAFESLKTKVQPMAPEVFDWMILEGYGKVLSRPGLDIDIRELSIVAFLIAENRPKQLWSHMKGAINVGVSIEHLRVVVADLGEAVGDGFRSATAIIERLS